MLSPKGLVVLNLRRILIVCTNTITIPLVVNSQLNLSGRTVTVLVDSSLFYYKVIALLRYVNVNHFVKVHLPIVVSIAFTTMAPVVTVKVGPSVNLLKVFNTAVTTNFVAALLTPLVNHLVPLFPPLIANIIVASVKLDVVRINVS